MKTTNNHSVTEITEGMIFQHKEKGDKATVIGVNKKSGTVMLEFKDKSTKDVTTSTLKRHYKLLSAANTAKSKATDGKDAKKMATTKKDSKSAKTTNTKGTAAAAAAKADKKYLDVCKQLIEHNKKAPEVLMTAIIVLSQDNFPDTDLTDLQRSYRILNNQPGLMPKTKGDPVAMFSLAGDDARRYDNQIVEEAYIEVGSK